MRFRRIHQAGRSAHASAVSIIATQPRRFLDRVPCWSWYEVRASDFLWHRPSRVPGRIQSQKIER
jgi:hypothetical protein